MSFLAAIRDRNYADEGFHRVWGFVDLATSPHNLNGGVDLPDVWLAGLERRLGALCAFENEGWNSAARGWRACGGDSSSRVGSWLIVRQ